MSKEKTTAIESKSGSSVFRTITFKDLGVTEVKRKLSRTAFSIWVRVLLQKWRQGTVGCKGRSDVSRTNKKPFKQKGTGRARAGTARSPLWRGGGVIFGPQPRVGTLRIPKALKKNVLGSITSQYLQESKVVALDWSCKHDRPKTADAYKVLLQAGLKNRKINLFVSFNDALTRGSFMNIPNVRVLFFDQANAYDLVNSEHWVVLDKDLNMFKEMVSQWI